MFQKSAALKFCIAENQTGENKNQMLVTVAEATTGKQFPPT